MLRSLWERNYSVYGRRKLTKAALRAGVDVGRDQVARLMRLEGIRGASRAKKRFTTRSDPAALRAPDLVNRDFTASRPDATWVADFTYCSTWSGIVYIAFVIDVFSRRIAGWKAARTMHASLVIDALNMAAWVRRGVDIDGVVCHSDAGAQGEFRWWSQHLETEAVREVQARAGRGDPRDERKDVVAGSTIDCSSRGSGLLLAGDRSRLVDGRCRCRGRRLIPGWSQVVPPGWRDALTRVGPGVGPLPVVR
jgi:putative transposase